MLINKENNSDHKMSVIHINLIIFIFFFLTESAHVVRFINDNIKSFTISSTVAKRRPAPPITPASAPQVLSPKRLCPQSLQTPIINQLYINNTTTTLPVTTSDLITKTTVSSQTITNHQNINMDNQMGQMGPMAPMALSQSMDSVNTASNEEEVSLFFRI